MDGKNVIDEFQSFVFPSVFFAIVNWIEVVMEFLFALTSINSIKFPAKNKNAILKLFFVSFSVMSMQ
jgi:hypothetical protein